MKAAWVGIALLLASCQQQGSDEAVDDVPIKDDGTPVGIDAIMTDDAKEDSRRAQARSDAEMAQPMGKAFPTAFQGKWDADTAACGKRYSDMRLTIKGDTVRHWESDGSVKELLIETPTKVTSTLDFSGEGENWQSTTEYEIVDGGKALIRSERDPALTVRYVRCR